MRHSIACVIQAFHVQNFSLRCKKDCRCTTQKDGQCYDDFFQNFLRRWHGGKNIFLSSRKLHLFLSLCLFLELLSFTYSNCVKATLTSMCQVPRQENKKIQKEFCLKYFISIYLRAIIANCSFWLQDKICRRICWTNHWKLPCRAEQWILYKILCNS